MNFKNPYLETLMNFKEFKSIENHRVNSFDHAQSIGLNIEDYLDNLLLIEYRDKLRMEYSYAIPNKESIKVICNYSPIWEIGSGTGYWAKLINEMGGNIVATEIFWDNPHFPNENIGTYYPVKSLPKEKYKDLNIPHTFTLFICWPPYGDNMAYNYLSNYDGNTFIYIGEDKGGCTGNDEFFDLLDDKWEIERTVSIPQFPCIHDYLAVYKRVDCRF